MIPPTVEADPGLPGPALAGRVVGVEGPQYWVDLAEGRRVGCRVPGRLKKGRRREKQPAVVGDYVLVELEAGGETGVIALVQERTTKLSRRASGSSRIEQVVVANVDGLLIVVALRSPPLRARFIDRLLVAADVGGLEPVICLNKVDLASSAAEAARELALYESLGYRVLRCSVVTGAGVDELGGVLRDRTFVVAGQSGVGKSSLLNAVDPALQLRTGEMSEANDRGCHTTTWVSLLPLAGGGYVVDTPGIRSFSMWDVEADQLGHHFREFAPLLASCHYPSCTHTHEPRCAIKRAVESGAIDPERYESYVAIRASILEDDAGIRR